MSLRPTNLPLIKKCEPGEQYFVGRFYGPAEANFQNCSLSLKTSEAEQSDSEEDAKTKKGKSLPRVEPLKSDAEFTFSSDGGKAFTGESECSQNSFAVIELSENSTLSCYPAWLYKFVPSDFLSGRRLPSGGEAISATNALKSVKRGGKRRLPTSHRIAQRESLLGKVAKKFEDEAPHNTPWREEMSSAKNGATIHHSDFCHRVKKSNEDALDNLLLSEQMGGHEDQTEQTGEYRMMDASDDEQMDEESQAVVGVPFEGFDEEDNTAVLDERPLALEAGREPADEIEGEQNNEQNKRFLSLLKGKIPKNSEKDEKTRKVERTEIVPTPDGPGKEEKSGAKSLTKKRGGSSGPRRLLPLEDRDNDSEEMAKGPPSVSIGWNKIQKKSGKAERDGTSARGVGLRDDEKTALKGGRVTEDDVVSAILEKEKIGSMELIRSLGLETADKKQKQVFVEIIKRVAVMKSQNGKKFFELKAETLERHKNRFGNK